MALLISSVLPVPFWSACFFEPQVTQVFTAALTFWGGIYKPSNVEQLQT